jgi:hypothetical protein
LDRNAEADGFGDRRNGDRVNEWLEAVDQKRAVNRAWAGLRGGSGHGGHVVAGHRIGLLGGEDAAFEGGKCGCPSAAFDQELSA